MRGRIFISYRRDDAAADARSIRDRLARKFGESSVFMDVNNLSAGQRFDQELDKALAQCEVLIAVIGQRWMDLLSDHRRVGRHDYVRDEIGAALRREIPVIPVLVGREGQLPSLPRADDLPKDLRELTRFQKHGVSHEKFDRDADELIAAIGGIFRERGSDAPWKGAAVGGATGLAAGVAALAVVAGTVVWISRPSAESTPSAKKAVIEIDAAAKKARDEEAIYRPSGETTKSVVEAAARTRLDYLEKQAATGNVPAMNRLASWYEEGNGVPKNLPLAINWYQKAADAGSDEAKASLRRLKVR